MSWIETAGQAVGLALLGVAGLGVVVAVMVGVLRWWVRKRDKRAEFARLAEFVRETQRRMTGRHVCSGDEDDDEPGAFR